MESICDIKHIYKALYDFEKSFALANEITLNEAMVLCCLKNGESKSASDLADYIGLSHSRVSRIINTIEIKGLVLREIGKMDKRQMIFTLTDLGRSKVIEMKEADIEIPELISKMLL